MFFGAGTDEPQFDFTGPIMAGPCLGNLIKFALDNEYSKSTHWLVVPVASAMPTDVTPPPIDVTIAVNSP